MLLAGLATVVGPGAASVAFAKCVLLAVLTCGFLGVLTRDARVSPLGLLLLYGLYLGPQTLKHGGSIDYEEGVLLDLSVCLAVAACYLFNPALTRSPRRRAAMGIAAVLVATAMYFTKTAALLTLGVVLVLALTRPWLGRTAKVALAGIVALAFILWGRHAWQSSGALHLASSWDGENLFRGSDSGTLALYPEISLDRAFDSTSAVLDDGTVVPLGNYSRERCYKDEWSWNDSYTSRALAWMGAHPLAAARFVAKKVWVALLEVRHTPKYVSATDKRLGYSDRVRNAMVAWMVFARLVFFALAARALLPRPSRTRAGGRWALVLVAAAFTPYLLAFSYQRQVVPILIMAGVLLSVLFLSEPRRVPATPPDFEPSP